jgi:hypothetical protein
MHGQSKNLQIFSVPHSINFKTLSVSVRICKFVHVINEKHRNIVAVTESNLIGVKLTVVLHTPGVKL